MYVHRFFSPNPTLEEEKNKNCILSTKSGEFMAKFSREIFDFNDICPHGQPPSPQFLPRDSVCQQNYNHHLPVIRLEVIQTIYLPIALLMKTYLEILI